jgi:hypothetical protein
VVTAVVGCLVLFNIVVQLTIETAFVAFTIENKTGLNKPAQNTLVCGKDGQIVWQFLRNLCKLAFIKMFKV